MGDRCPSCARLLLTLAEVLEQATGEDSEAISAYRDGFLLLAEHGLFHVRTHVHRRVTGEYDREKLRALADGGGEGESK